MKPQRHSLGDILSGRIYPSPEWKSPVASDRDALRALTDEADYLGVDPDGRAWLLVRTTPELVAWLETMDAEIEDREDGDAGEPIGDDEPDEGDFEPDDEREDDTRDLRGAPTTTRWAKAAQGGRAIGNHRTLAHGVTNSTQPRRYGKRTA